MSRLKEGKDFDMEFRELIEAVDDISHGRVGGVYDRETLAEMKDWGTPFDELGLFIFRALSDAGCDWRVDRHSLQTAAQRIRGAIETLRAVDEFIIELQQRVET